MQDAFLTVALLVGLGVASWRDLRAREVPDLVSLGLVALGVLGALSLAIVARDPWRLVPAITGVVAGFAMGTVLYRTRQWGGGDAKLLAGVGAILGLWAPGYRLLVFLVLLAFSGAAYGIAWTAWLIVRHWRPFRTAFARRIREPGVHRVRLALVGLGAVGILLLLFVPWPYTLLIGLALLGAYLLLYGWIVSRTLEETALTKDCPVGNLEEGDWLVADVRKGARLIARASRTGVSLREIAALRRARVRTVRVREGIPFVPAFLIAAVMLLLLESRGVGFAALLG